MNSSTMVPIVTCKNILLNKVYKLPVHLLYSVSNYSYGSIINNVYKSFSIRFDELYI